MVKCDLELWPHTWTWPWIFMVKFRNSCISEWEGRLTLHKGGGSRSFMTMTIWWPRSGVWIYQIVTGVTSVVGVPSTHLVVNELVQQKHVDVTSTKIISRMICSIWVVFLCQCSHWYALYACGITGYLDNGIWALICQDWKPALLSPVVSLSKQSANMAQWLRILGLVR